MLCKRIIEEERRVWLSGGEIHSLISFWDQILHRLRIPINRSSETFHEKSLDLCGKLESGRPNKSNWQGWS